LNKDTLSERKGTFSGKKGIFFLNKGTFSENKGIYIEEKYLNLKKSSHFLPTYGTNMHLIHYVYYLNRFTKSNMIGFIGKPFDVKGFADISNKVKT